MRILVTNDDGVRAPGIAALALVAASTGHDVVVVAPLIDYSGAGRRGRARSIPVPAWTTRPTPSRVWATCPPTASTGLPPWR